MVDDMAGGIFQFSSVDGTNNLLASIQNGFWDIQIPLFADSTSQLEDGMGAYMSLMLSNIYLSNSVSGPPYDKATLVVGGQMVTTVGLGKDSRLYIWLVLAIVPLLTLIIASVMPLDYIPPWDVMNTMDALATHAVIDESIPLGKTRSSGIKLGLVDGRIVASNTNLPVRISKANTS